MTIKLPAIALVAMFVPGAAGAAMLTDAEATFLDELATAAAVLEQRCTGYEVNGAGGVQRGAQLLGSPNAAMALIDAYGEAIKAHDGQDYDRRKLSPEVFEAARRTSRQVRADLIRDPKRACTDYGEPSVERGLLRRY